MFLEVIQWFGAMILIFGALMVLWVIADQIAEKKHRLSERLDILERWKAGIELAEAEAERETRARILEAEKVLEEDKADFRRQNELAAILHADDDFDKEYKRLLNGN